MPKKAVLLPPLALAAWLVVGVDLAAAQPKPGGGEVNSITVHTTDLNLRTESGAQLLMLRIRDAARVVCGGDDLLDDRRSASRYRACVADATNRAALALVVARDDPAPRITVLASAAR